MHPMLNTALKAARRAGNIINRAALDAERLQITRKGAQDFVTEVDIACEEAIIDILHTAYPDHAFLAEESGALHMPANDEPPEFQWIIDPLDGTTNFIHGVPIYATSIALLHHGKLAHALIYDPTRNELFTATRGAGAFLNDRRIRVSGRLYLGDSLLGARWPGSSGPDDQQSTRYKKLTQDSAGVRRTGSSVLDLVYVAAGRLDGFCGSELKPWDLAAAGLLILEAGGLISDFSGEQGWLHDGNVVAATPKVFPQILGYVRNGSD
jgi:myo-inositol-1(or 4)-monophosphatase